MKIAKILNLVSLNIGWFASVLGAGNGLPWLGPAVVAVLALAHLAYFRFDRNIALFYACACLLGIIADGALVLTDQLAFPSHAQLLTPLALWMPAMWVNFATAMHLSLSFFKGRYIIGAILGLISAPGTYYAGVVFDAVILRDPLPISMGAVGVEWLIAFPLLIWLAGVFQPAARTGRTDT